MKADEVRGILRGHERWDEKAMEKRIAELEAALAPFAALPTSTVEIEDTRVTVRVNKRDILAAKSALKR